MLYVQWEAYIVHAPMTSPQVQNSVASYVYVYVWVSMKDMT